MRLERDSFILRVLSDPKDKVLIENVSNKTVERILVLIISNNLLKELPEFFANLKLFHQ